MITELFVQLALQQQLLQGQDHFTRLLCPTQSIQYCLDDDTIGDPFLPKETIPNAGEDDRPIPQQDHGLLQVKAKAGVVFDLRFRPDREVGKRDGQTMGAMGAAVGQASSTLRPAQR
jgi:hypothetical protein